MSDDDDDLLLATSFTFRNKQRLSTCPSDDEESKPKLRFADILGADAEKEAMMASEDFWDRIAKPTQEEQLLRVEQEERQRLDEESEDEEEQSDFYSCLMHQTDEASGDDEDEDELNVPVFKQIKSHLGFPDAQPIAPLLSSCLFADLIQIAILPLDTRTELFVSAIDSLLDARKNRLHCFENLAIGLIRKDDFDFQYTEDRLRQWLMRLGICTKVGRIADQAIASPLEERIFCKGANLQSFIKVLLADLRGNNGRFQLENVPSTIFQVFLPILFDPRLEAARPEIEELLQCCVEWVPVCLTEKVSGWFEPLKEFILSPVSRLVTTLRILSCSQKASLCVLPVLDHFMHDQSIEEDMDSDSRFMKRVFSFCDAFTKDDNSCLSQLAHFLELTYLRLAGTSIEDMNLDDLAGLKDTLQTTKNSIPLQPSIRNLRCISLLSRMLIFLETSLRSRGFGLHKLHSTFSNI